MYQLPGQPLRLGEVKTISANKGWYGERYHLPGTLRRARVVGPAYLSHARAIDRKLHLAVGDPANPHGPNLAPGPVELRLRLVAPVVALVVGAWGEVSDDLRRLVDNLAIVGADKMAAQLCLPRAQATAWVRQAPAAGVARRLCLDPRHRPAPPAWHDGCSPGRRQARRSSPRGR